mgnify:CR=1 FL=1
MSFSFQWLINVFREINKIRDANNATVIDIIHGLKVLNYEAAKVFVEKYAADDL